MGSLNIASSYILLDIIAVFLLLFFSAFLFSFKSEHSLRQRLLAAFLLALALSYMDGLFISLNLHYQINYHHIVYASMSFDFLVGPLLYLFILSTTNGEFKLKRVHILHAIPFLMHATFLLLARITHTENSAEPVFSRPDIVALTISSSSHLFIYLGFVIYELLKYKRKLKDNYASYSKHGLQWLTIISTGLLFASIMRLSNNLLWLFNPQFAYDFIFDLKLFAIMGVFVFSCTVVFKSLKQPALLEYSTAEKYRSSRLSNELRAQILEKIKAYMTNEAPYLEPSFDLQSLSKGIDVQPHHISQVLNSDLQQNFFDFVNSYRINASQKMLGENAKPGKNITQIMYDVGFNSKSVFNTAFKKYTGLTPSQYRRNLREHTLQ